MNMQKKLKYMGTSVSILAALSFIVLLVATLNIASNSHISCAGYPTCSVIGHIPLEYFAGMAALAGVAVLGGYTSLLGFRTERIAVEKSAATAKAVKSLAGDEKVIYETVAKSDGAAMQSDIIKSTSFSKVKVSRVLDRLEAKGFLERRRRGMANIIIIRK